LSRWSDVKAALAIYRASHCNEVLNRKTIRACQE
jgi:hypothetical protein